MKRKHTLYLMMIVLVALYILQAISYSKRKQNILNRIETLQENIEANNLKFKVIVRNQSLLFENELSKLDDVSLWNASSEEYRLSQILSDEKSLIFYFDQECCSDCIEVEIKQLITHFEKHEKNIIIISNFAKNSDISRFRKNYHLQNVSCRIFQIKETPSNLKIPKAIPFVFIVEQLLYCHLFFVIDYHQPKLTSTYYKIVQNKFFNKN